VAEAIAAKYPDAATFSDEKLADIIKNDTSAINEASNRFLERHGHRAIREAEMRSAGWKADQPAYLENIRAVLSSKPLTSQTARTNEKTTDSSVRSVPSVAKNQIDAYLADKKGGAAGGLRFVVNQARQAVVNREFTKSKWVLTLDKLKTAYRQLASLLVERGTLPDADLIYFLTHKEIGELIEGKTGLVKKAVQRRRLLPEQMDRHFAEVTVGKIPEPITFETEAACNGTVLKGAPISRGIAKGRARVVKSVEDAKLLVPGEIMVASFTDIGWSPYYSVIAGLVTEVGSALSHGAVVAREYALPVVANVAGATSRIATGVSLRIDGGTGEVTVE
jgi:pyruvate,water dikinase